MPDSVDFTWFPMWWFCFDLCINSSTLKVAWSSSLRCSVEPFAEKLPQVFLQERQRDTSTLGSAFLHSWKFLIQVHVSNFEVLGMSVVRVH